METDLSITADVNDGCKYWATFEDHPFAAGQCRYAYKGVLHGNGPRDRTACVTKVFKDEYAMQTRIWIPDVKASKTAKGYADEFMRLHQVNLQNYIGDNTIEFVVPIIAKMEKVTPQINLIKVGEVVGIEPFIPGNYTKFNNNGGYENGAYQLMTAFCHWTYHKSGGSHMVCDLQGVKSGNRYILTDPVIHSSEKEYGSTDFGIEGMKKVLANHKCNVLCQYLGLHNPMVGSGIPPGPKTTVYRFQVTEQNMLTYQ